MQVLMLYYGRQFIKKGQMTTGSLVSFVLYQSDLGLGIRVQNNLHGSTEDQPSIRISLIIQSNY